ncbi:2-hydroxyacyl-CoA dehydratase family protein [Hornefia butyriciproducens]|nr:2-hydroxyacyl-CoA dehydratase family protein [Hornefia butyriciproducens]MCI7413335.1 2-hydroxyacyl-CoA dehydratase family protein [Clostridiales bacterium]MDY6212030.1 2-hydroxyacyl-CoA dehydratase family protein [Hornefia butyriciproducens]
MYEPEKKRGQYMLNLAEQYNADAIVVMMMKFCDPEQYDYPIYKAELEAAGIPFLYMEVDQQTTGFEQLRTRIQSFCEMLM